MLRPVVPDRVELSLKGVVEWLRQLLGGRWLGCTRPGHRHRRQLLNGCDNLCRAMLRPVVPDRVELSLKGVVGWRTSILAVGGWVVPDPDTVTADSC